MKENEMFFLTPFIGINKTDTGKYMFIGWLKRIIIIKFV